MPDAFEFTPTYDPVASFSNPGGLSFPLAPASPFPSRPAVVQAPVPPRPLQEHDAQGLGAFGNAPAVGFDPVAGLRPVDAPWFTTRLGEQQGDLGDLDLFQVDPTVAGAAVPRLGSTDRATLDRMTGADLRDKALLDEMLGYRAEDKAALDLELREGRRLLAASGPQASAKAGEAAASGEPYRADALHPPLRELVAPRSVAASTGGTATAPAAAKSEYAFQFADLQTAPSFGGLRVAPVQLDPAYAGTKQLVELAPIAAADGSQRITGVRVNVLSKDAAAARRAEDPLAFISEVTVGKNGAFDLGGAAGIDAKVVAQSRAAVEQGVGTAVVVRGRETVQKSASGDDVHIVAGNLVPQLKGKYVLPVAAADGGTVYRFSTADDPNAVYINDTGSYTVRAKASGFPEPPKKEWYENPMAMLAVSSALSVIGVIGQYFIAKDGSDTQLKINRDNRNMQLELLGMQLAATQGGGGGGDGGGSGSLRAGRV